MKRLLIPVILIWSAMMVWANTSVVVKPNQWSAWLEQTDLRLQRAGFGQTITLRSFSQEVSSFDLSLDSSRAYLIYEADEQILFSSSYNNGQTFTASATLSAQGHNPSLAANGQTVWLAWSTDGAIKLQISQDSGRNFSPTFSISLTDEASSSPRLWLDQQNKLHLVWLSQNNDQQLNKINYQSLAFNNSQLASSEITTLYQSPDDLTDLQIQALGQQSILAVSWQLEYAGRRQSYCSISLAAGEHFGQARALNFELPLLALARSNDKIIAYTFNGQVKAQELTLTKPAAPVIQKISDSSVIFSVSDNPPLLCQLELDNTAGLAQSQTLEQLVLINTRESLVFSLPDNLADASYQARLSVFDGFQSSPASLAVSFAVDTIAPEFVSFESSRQLDQLVYQGQISGLPADLRVNQQAVPLDSNGNFSGSQTLEAGNNLLSFCLSDEAGNLNFSTLEVFYNPASPEISVLSPQATDWFKPEASLAIEGKVNDLQGDIEDGTEAQLLLDGQLLEHTLIFDQSDSSLFGLVSLPDKLSDGQHKLTLRLTDQQGNTGEREIYLNIDGSPPECTLAPDNRQFSNDPAAAPLPLVDQGAGLDLNGTLITIDQLTLEGYVTLEGNQVRLHCSNILSEGSHEVELCPRDQIGNLASSVTYSLIIDTTSPQIILEDRPSGQIKQNQITIKGTLNDAYPDSIKVINNQVVVKQAAVNSSHFAVDVKLNQGSNIIVIEAADQAGNKTSETLNLFAAQGGSSNLISDFSYGPNPFSPQKNLPGAFASQGKGMIFAYSLAQPADIKIRIYDITGTLIWVKSVNSASSGVTAWTGQDQFGRISPNGVYPYFFTVTGNGQSETRRGKIIINQ